MASITKKAISKGGMYCGTCPGVGHNTSHQLRKPKLPDVIFLITESPCFWVLIYVKLIIITHF